MIRIPPHVVADMTAHARAEAPVEACGLLAGAGGVVHRSYRMANVDASPEHFSLDPREQLAVIREARAAGLSLLALYHSHPATPARMSDEDLRLAFTPGVRHVILSLRDPERPELRSFIVADGQAVDEGWVLEEER